MDRRRFLRGVAGAGLGAFAAPMLNLGRCRLFADDGVLPPSVNGDGEVTPGPGLAAKRALTVSTRALDLVQRVPVIDMLGLLTLDWPKLARWQRQKGAFGEAEFRRLRRSGVTLFHPAVDPNQADAAAAVSRWMAGWNRMLAAYPHYLQRVESVADLETAKRDGRVGLLLGFQNSDHFARVADVARFHALGQRVSQLTYDRNNRLGGGCRADADPGLSGFGSEVVRAMNDVGMAVDVSHCGERTTLDAFAASCRPVLVTHANCRALVPGHPRCKSDRVLRTMALQGGVIGITAVRAYVRQRETPTVDHLLDHFEHVARVAGVEHVGLGSDVDVDARDRRGRVRPAYAIDGLDHARRVFALVEGLLRRGWSDVHVELALGGNFRRALGEIWVPTAAPPTVGPAPAAAAAAG
jgi:membrane dipeptidase